MLGNRTISIFILAVFAGTVFMCNKWTSSKPFPEPDSVDLRCRSSLEDAKTRIESLLINEKIYLRTKQHDKAIRVYSDYGSYKGPLLGIRRKQYEARCKYMVELGKSITDSISIDLTIFIVMEIRPDSLHEWKEDNYPGRKDDKEKLLSGFIRMLRGIGYCK